MQWVHWFALLGLVWFMAGTVTMQRAWHYATRAARLKSIIQLQLELFLEARALAEYGARDEANDVLAEAIRLGDEGP